MESSPYSQLIQRKGLPTVSETERDVADLKEHIKQEHVKDVRKRREHYPFYAIALGLIAVAVFVFIGATTWGVNDPPPQSTYAQGTFVITDAGTKIAILRFEEALSIAQGFANPRPIPITATLSFLVEEDVFVFSATVRMNRSVIVDDDLTVRGNLEVDGTSEFKQGVVMRETLAVEGDVAIEGNLSVDQSSTFAGDVQMETTLEVTGDVEMDSTLAVAGNITSLTSVRSTGTMYAVGLIASQYDVRVANTSLVQLGLLIQMMCNNCPLCECCTVPPC